MIVGRRWWEGDVFIWLFVFRIQCKYYFYYLVDFSIFNAKRKLFWEWGRTKAKWATKHTHIQAKRNTLLLPKCSTSYLSFGKIQILFLSTPTFVFQTICVGLWGSHLKVSSDQGWINAEAKFSNPWTFFCLFLSFEAFFCSEFWFTLDSTDCHRWRASGPSQDFEKLEARGIFGKFSPRKLFPPKIFDLEGLRILGSFRN